MPLTVFDIKGVPGSLRERIEAAVVAGGGHASGPHEAWIGADPFNGGFRVLVTGPHAFARTVTFAIDDDPAVNRGAREGDVGSLMRPEAPMCLTRSSDGVAGVGKFGDNIGWCS